MKKNLYLAQKYAKAFDSCANNLKEAKVNFLCYQNALKKTEPLKEIIENPVITFNLKEPVLKELLGQDIGAAFVCLLICAKRFNLAKIIEKELLFLLDKRQGLIRAKITTAAPLNKTEQEELEKILKNYFKREVSFSFSEDKNILGGIIIKIEDLCIDGSILNRLKDLKQALKR